MRRSFWLVMTTGLLVATLAVPGFAITNGTDDHDEHPNVGGLAAHEAYSDGTYIYCSGTLIAPRVFLTAAHCGDDGDDDVRVTFNTEYAGGNDYYVGTFHSDPGYGPVYVMSDPHDIAVVVFEEDVEGIDPATLPEAGSLSDLSRGTKITSVGYGAYEVSNGPGGKSFLYNDVRMKSVGSLLTINKAWLRISMNPARGDGGTCYGDSGGPNFLGGDKVLAAITITGDAVCRATNVVYRLDTPSARAFLDQFVDLSE